MYNDFVKTTLTIQKRTIEVLEGMLEHDSLRFYPENPRIYSIVCATGETPSQESIFDTLSRMDHVKRLYNAIKANGGLTDPIIVKRDTLEVLEGNSRLAAYRLLAKNDPLQWNNIFVRLLPNDISDSEVFSLLGEYHVHGKKDWAPFEVANYVYRRHIKHLVSKQKIASELAMPVRAISHLVDVVQFMLEKGEETPNRWSYYDEYLKSRKISKAREDNPLLDDVVIEQIQNGTISKAADIRDKQPVIVKNKKNLKKYIDGSRNFADAYDSALAQGADSTLFKKLHRARETFADAGLDDELAQMSPEILKKCEFEVRKLHTRFAQLSERIKKLISP